MFFSVLCLLYLCERLSICALWSCAGKELSSWLSFVVSNCKFVTFHSSACTTTELSILLTSCYWL